MKDPEATLQKIKVERARGQGFTWGLWIGGGAVASVFWLLGMLP